LGFTFSQLFFFGTLMMIPMDLMFFAEENANVWGFLIPFLIGSLTLYYLHKMNTTKNEKIKLNSKKYNLGMGIFLNIIFSGLVFIVFINFTTFNSEPWLIQSGWFMRKQGIIWSLLLGSAVFSGLVVLDELAQLKPILASKISLILGKTKWNLTIGLITSLFSLLLTLGFSGVLLMLYRIYTLFGVFLFTFLLTLLMAIIYILSKGMNFSYIYTVFSLKSDTLADENNLKRELRRTRMKSAFFLILAGISLVIMTLYFFNIAGDFKYPPGVNANHFIWPVQQVLTIIIGVIVGIVVTGGFSRFILRNSVYSKMKPTSNKIANKVIQGIFGIAIFVATTFILGILGLGLYIFEFVLYLPQVLTYTFVWVILGVLLFLLIEKLELKPKLRYSISYTMIIIAFLLLITNFWALALDLIENASSINDGSFDLYFPFDYLFSNKNILFIGISMGYLLSSLVKTISKGIKKTDLPKYENSIPLLFLFLAPVAIGCLIGFSSMVINLEGGDPTLAMFDSNMIISLLRFGVILVLVLMLLRFNIAAAQGDKEEKNADYKTQSPNLKEILESVSSNISSIRGKNSKKIKATAIMSIVLIGVIAGGFGAAIGLTAVNVQGKPVLISTSGYDLWVANSSERFNHQTRIPVSSSPQIDRVTFNMAKNEYYAFQLGMTLKSKSAVFHSYYLTDFRGVENSSHVISSNAGQLRYEEYILEDEFPDKLIPIFPSNPIPLAKRQTHMFWFDIRTPYNLTSGYYEGTLTIVFKLGGEFLQEEIAIRFFVWDFAIPYQKHVTTSVGDASVSSEEIYNQMMESWHDHRFNSYAEDIKGTDDYGIFEYYNGKRIIYYLNKTDGSVTFNWTLWDQKIGDLLNTTNAPMNGIRVDYSLGRSLKIGNETENGWFLNWLVEVEHHLEMKGWLNICYYYFVDEFTLFIPDEYESRETYYDAVEEQLASMESVAPKIRKLAIAPPLPELDRLKPYIDIWVPLSYDRNVEQWEKAKADGEELWFYTCVGPFAPYPNVHLYNRMYETRLQMWNAWDWGVTGYLFWRANSFQHGQYGFGYNGYGDGWLIYIDESAGRFYESLRWENLGDGQEDYEMFWLLNATLNGLEEEGSLPQSQIDMYRNKLFTVIDKVADDFLDYTNNPHDIYNGIEAIGQILHYLSSFIDIQEIGEAVWYPISGVSP
jgi:hypothetical protein